MSLDPARRGALLQAKLAALVRDNGPARDWLRDAQPLTVGADAALLDTTNGIGWVLVDADHTRALGRALAWATAQHVAQLHLLVDSAEAPGAAGVLARRAMLVQLDDGAPTVWTVHGREMEVASPAPGAVPPTSHGPEAAALATFLRDVGTDVLVEHECVVGEVKGLEVARTVHDASGVHLEVGVGRHDREAFGMLHADVEPRTALPGIVELVRSHRHRGAAPHPLNRLAAQRWLLREVIEQPGMVGLRALDAVAGPAPRGSIDDLVPAFALGVGEDGTAAVVAASVGIDADLVPAALDVWAQRAPEAEIVLVVPERDAVASLHRVAELALAPVRVVTVPDDWRG